MNAAYSDFLTRSGRCYQSLHILMISMRTSDGCRLDCVVWRPGSPGHYPVLLMRQPRGRAIAPRLVFAQPGCYGAHGDIAAIQDVLGTGGSSETCLLLHRHLEGTESVACTDALTGATGQALSRAAVAARLLAVPAC